MYDIALPKDNEEDLVRKYIENGIKNVVFAYFIENRRDIETFLLNRLLKYKNLNLFYLAIVNSKKTSETMKIALDLFYLEKYYNDLVFIKFDNSLSSYRIFGKYFYNGVYIDKIVGNEKFYFRNIDLSSIYKIKKNRQSVLLSLKDALDNPYPFKYLIKVLSKKDVMIIFGSFASDKSEVPNKYAIKSFYKVFGIDYSLKLMEEFLFYQINRTRLAKNKFYLTDGYYIVKMPYEDCSEY
ncbi:MAG: hypothetical protein BXU00_01220 [Candidatus Nanoclepta minutus]|uniref:Uncharacterized protein n=1 Tax=Candidatus Nanoclepta minutus TaxID=1940235 RepID=A0A397WPD9_9ARCH|nr:MAG: hypothetical protein BXU00_01220 [Candidatus Nanoclepta minutus]